MRSVAEHARTYARLYALLAAALTAAALYLGSGLATLPDLTWFAPLPLLVVAPRISARLAALTAFVGWSAGLANLVPYLLHDLDLPPVALSFLLLLASVFTLTVLVFRSLVTRGRFVLAALAAPATWAACDFLIAMVSPHGAFTSLAYTQADVHVVAQVVSLTGPWGLSFLLFVPASVVAVLLGPGVGARTAMQVSIACVVLAAGTLGYGIVRLVVVGGPADGRPVRVALVSADLDDDARWRGGGGRAILAAYGPEVAAAAAGGARVVLLPEKVIDVDAGDLSVVRTQLQALATNNNVELVVGLTVFDEGGNDYNRALAFHPDGRTPVSYDKHHLIPGLEPYQPGDRLGLLPRTNGRRWGVLICKDLDFPALSRSYGTAGVDLLLVPALDFETDGWLHSRMALLRGIENGIPMARAGSKGVLTLSDAYGRIVDEVPAPPHSTVTLTAELTPGLAPTLSTRWGEWFGWLCCLVALAGVVMGARRRTARGRG